MVMKIRVWVGKSRIAGKGLFVAQDIKKGTRLIQYTGQKISKEETARQLALGNPYICYFNERYDIDGRPLKNKARYINHSCDPNCQIQSTSRSIWIVARRDIDAGEELTYRYDYAYDPETYTDFPCYCGTKNCVGYIVDSRYWGVVKSNQKKKHAKASGQTEK
jgi:SET domain-containing protein